MQSLLCSLDQEPTTKYKLIMKTQPLVGLNSGPNPFLMRLRTAGETPGETSACKSSRAVLTSLELRARWSLLRGSR